MSIASREFAVSGGGMSECFVAMTSAPGRDFVSEARDLLARYAEIAAERQTVWMKFHLSDVTNQAPELKKLLAAAGYHYTILIGQPPIGGRLALEAYLLPPSVTVQSSADGAEVKLEHYTLVFSHRREVPERGSAEQTTGAFRQIADWLAARGGTLAANLQRTWLYCRDIDNNYAGLVKARRDFFTASGLTSATHYIASTGIEGSAEAPEQLVSMENFILFGHRAEQIEYMEALDKLSPTHLYGVTFERGTRILYGDRSHWLVSGTASIDAAGQIVHPGDVAGQTERMVENFQALLTNHGAALSDLQTAVIYLRDPADAATVNAVLGRVLDDAIPRIMVRGTVCRPGWLVEMEGVAVNACGDRRFAALC